jgi:hypothetical protein
MLDGNITDKIMIGLAIFIGICLFPLVIYKSLKTQAQNLKDYFSNNRVIFKRKVKNGTKKDRSKTNCKGCY